MATTGLWGRWRVLLGDPGEPEPGHWADALTVAYQHRLAWLREIRAESDRVAAQRRRLAVGVGPLPDPEARRSAAAQDAELAGQQEALLRLGTAARAQLEQFRAERDLIISLPDPTIAARRARAALQRWQLDSERLLRDAEAGYPEPSGFVPDDAQPGVFEQPPGQQR